MREQIKGSRSVRSFKGARRTPSRTVTTQVQVNKRSSKPQLRDNSVKETREPVKKPHTPELLKECSTSFRLGEDTAYVQILVGIAIHEPVAPCIEKLAAALPSSLEGELATITFAKDKLAQPATIDSEVHNSQKKRRRLEVL